jgi:hypothetical protein
MALLFPGIARAQSSSSPLSPLPSSSSKSSPSRSSKPVKRAAAAANSPLNSGTVSNGVYRNTAFGFTCKIPVGWVLRTEELNARDDETAASKESRASLDRAAEGGCPHTNGPPPSGCGRVLLAAFSRPPEARGEDVNGSILIAAESVATYPGLTDAAQYLSPVTEVAKAQGFEMEEDPYEVLLGGKTLAQGDFQKDVGSRLIRQSTLVLLTRGYALSFTFIAGTEDDVAELIEGLSFQSTTMKKKN